MSSLFGGGSAPQLGPAPKINFSPAGFNSSGGSLGFSGGGYNLTPSAGATSALGSLQSTFGQQAGAYGALAKTVQPGFSQLRRAGLNQINTQQQATTSNLRDNLAQRRILGSSFAQDSLGRSDAEFAQKKADFVAQSYLSEVQTSQQLIQQQYQAAAQQYSVGINQMNFDTGVAAQLTAGMNSALAGVAEAQAKLDQTQAITQAQMNMKSDEANAAGIGKLIGTGLSLGLAPFTGGASLAGLPAIWGGGGGGSSGGGFFGGNGGGLSLPGGYKSFADAGIGGGVGTGGFNFMDAQV